MKKKKLNKIQNAAVEAVNKPVLIFAGAGSGKTRVLTQKIAFLIEQDHVKPENILAVTFTNKAAREMRERVSKLIDNSQSKINMGTFHSICARLLRAEIHNLDYTSAFVIYDSQDQISVVKVIMAAKDISKSDISPQEIRKNISYFNSKMITPAEALSKTRTVRDRKIAEVFGAYKAELKKNNAVDFDDLLLLPLEIFEKFPAILKKYQEKWQYILVDEYQDTNRPQFLLVSQLASNHRQICVVGDDDQSIYGWRGADIRNILDFEKTFGDCHVFKLEKNYRSTRYILSSASAVVRNNIDRAEKELTSVNGYGEKLSLIETDDEMEEADAVIQALEKEIKLHKRSFSHFAVLYRTNAQSRALEDSFRRTGIPYSIVGGIRFYDRKEVKDILAYLKLLVNLKDTISLRRVINFPPRGIGMKTVDKCLKQSQDTNQDLLEVLARPEDMDIYGKQAESLKNFYDSIKKYNELLDKLGAGELIGSLIEETGILKYYKKNITPENRETFENVKEFMNSVDEFMNRNSEGSLVDFLEEVSLLTDIDSWNDQKNSVTLMTIHSSKGLEFPVVFITGLEDGLFPIYQNMESREKLEEERRLFYVGLTRAMSKVYLMYANHRRRIGADDLYGIVSRFVREIPKDNLEKISFKSALTRKIVKAGRGKSQMIVKRTVTIFDDFKIGDQIKHAIFGVGEIKALSGQGENQRVGVVFKDGLKKKLIVKFANLKKI